MKIEGNEYGHYVDVYGVRPLEHVADDIFGEAHRAGRYSEPVRSYLAPCLRLDVAKTATNVGTSG